MFKKNRVISTLTMVLLMSIITSVSSIAHSAQNNSAAWNDSFGCQHPKDLTNNINELLPLYIEAYQQSLDREDQGVKCRLFYNVRIIMSVFSSPGSEDYIKKLEEIGDAMPDISNFSDEELKKYEKWKHKVAKDSTLLNALAIRDISLRLQNHWTDKYMKEILRMRSDLGLYYSAGIGGTAILIYLFLREHNMGKVSFRVFKRLSRYLLRSRLNYALAGTVIGNLRNDLVVDGSKRKVPKSPFEVMKYKGDDQKLENYEAYTLLRDATALTFGVATGVMAAKAMVHTKQYVTSRAAFTQFAKGLPKSVTKFGRMAFSLNPLVLVASWAGTEVVLRGGKLIFDKAKEKSLDDSVDQAVDSIKNEFLVDDERVGYEFFSSVHKLVKEARARAFFLSAEVSERYFSIHNRVKSKYLCSYIKTLPAINRADNSVSIVESKEYIKFSQQFIKKFIEKNKVRINQIMVGLGHVDVIIEHWIEKSKGKITDEEMQYLYLEQKRLRRSASFYKRVLDPQLMRQRLTQEIDQEIKATLSFLQAGTIHGVMQLDNTYNCKAIQDVLPIVGQMSESDVLHVPSLKKIGDEAFVTYQTDVDDQMLFYPSDVEYVRKHPLSSKSEFLEYFKGRSEGKRSFFEWLTDPLFAAKRTTTINTQLGRGYLYLINRVRQDKDPFPMMFYTLKRTKNPKPFQDVPFSQLPFRDLIIGEGAQYQNLSYTPTFKKCSNFSVECLGGKFKLREIKNFSNNKLNQYVCSTLHDYNQGVYIKEFTDENGRVKLRDYQSYVSGVLVERSICRGDEVTPYLSWRLKSRIGDFSSYEVY